MARLAMTLSGTAWKEFKFGHGTKACAEQAQRLLRDETLSTRCDSKDRDVLIDCDGGHDTDIQRKHIRERKMISFCTTDPIHVPGRVSQDFGHDNQILTKRE